MFTNYDLEIQKKSPSFIESFDKDKEPDLEYHPEDDEERN